MEDFRKSISLRCVFCRSYEFALPFADYTPAPGGFVVCANCGRENDVSSLLIVAKGVGISLVKEHAQQLVDEMAKEMKRALRNNKLIKFK